MAYPIQPTPVASFLNVDLNPVSNFDIVVDLKPYVTSITGNNGSVSDQYYCTLEPGICTVNLYDHAALLASGHLTIGARFNIHSSGTFTYRGNVSDIQTTYELDAVTNTLKPRTQFTVGNIVSKAANITAKENTLMTGGGLTQPLQQLAYRVHEQSGVYTQNWWFDTTHYINQFNASMSILDALNMAARSTNQYLTNDPWYVRGNSITTPSTYPYLITDGTHTSTDGATVLSPIDIDHGYNSSKVLTEVNIVNRQLNRPPRGWDDRTQTEFNVTYQVKQTLGEIHQSADVDTCVATPILGWNYLSNSWSRPELPNVSGDGWSYFSLGINYDQLRTTGNSITMQILGTCPYGQKFEMFNHNEYPDLIANPPTGVHDSNWHFRFYVQLPQAEWDVPPVIRPYIHFVDSRGSVIATSYGSESTITNYGSWESIAVFGGAPGAVSLDAGFETVGSGDPITEGLVITDASLVQEYYWMTYDGDTPNTTDRIYSWVGSRFSSPSQKTLNNLKPLGDTILARNTPQEITSTVTLNALESWDDVRKIMWGSQNQNSDSAVKVCVNGETKNYRAVGYDFTIEPEHMEVTFNLVHV
jgi:hypothetical protein